MTIRPEDNTVAAEGAKRLYKSTIPFNNIIYPNGHVAHFKGGMYATDDPTYIEYLDAQIARNGFGGVVYIDQNARTITAEQENPMLALRRKLFAEFEAERAAKMNPANDMGNSDQGKLKPASTTDIAPVALGGDASSHLRAAVAARTAEQK
jgi:hypothetical protein